MQERRGTQTLIHSAFKYNAETIQKSMLTERVKNSPAYTLQLDASCEGHNSYALNFVCYSIWEDSIHEDIFYCLEHETAHTMFIVLCSYMEENRSCGIE